MCIRDRLGAFMPPVIKAKKMDAAHGLDIEFVERPPDAYTTQFNSGEFKVGGSAAVLTVGQADARGVKVKYLFNLFDFWGTVVTSRPEIKTLKDLEGKQLAAAGSTTNFVMFEFFAKKLGVDVSKVQVLTTCTLETSTPSFLAKNSNITKLVVEPAAASCLPSRSLSVLISGREVTTVPQKSNRLNTVSY